MRYYILCLVLLNGSYLLATKPQQQIMFESTEEIESDEYGTSCIVLPNCLGSLFQVPYYCCLVCVLIVCEKDMWDPESSYD